MLYIMNVGLEHLQSGIEFDNQTSICFEKDGPTTFVVWSHTPFRAKWKLADRNEPLVMESYHSEYNPPMPDTMNLVREKVERNDILKGENLLGGMEVLLRTKETVFLRIPRKLQVPSFGDGKCSCEACNEMRGSDWERNDVGKWDTLAVPRNPPEKGNDYANTCHFPLRALAGAREYWMKKGELIEKNRK